MIFPFPWVQTTEHSIITSAPYVGLGGLSTFTAGADVVKGYQNITRFNWYYYSGPISSKYQSCKICPAVPQATYLDLSITSGG